MMTKEARADIARKLREQLESALALADTFDPLVAIHIDTALTLLNTQEADPD